MNIGGNAPGVSFERLIYGLSNHHIVDVFTILNDSNNSIEKVHSIESLPYIKTTGYRQSQLIFLFGLNPFDVLWAVRVKKAIIQRHSRYDIVISFISNEHYAGLVAGVVISKALNIKFAVFSVDAIPAPLGWSYDDLYFRSCKNFINKYLSKANVFLSTNEKMLDYEKSLIKNNNILFDIIYNPSPLYLSVFEKPQELIFLYTGEIYRIRHVRYLFKAFQMVLKEYPNVELHFVGSNIPDADKQVLNERELEAVKIFPRIKDLSPYYEKSFCLIDIDADLENDVYLSSKITTYITINRPIICQTGRNSPSRHIFNRIPSIIQCDHSPFEIYKSMIKLIEYPITEFSDRKEVIEQFSLEHNINRLNLILSEVR